ncbi:hypothetical protein BC834DRAFT_970998 [Gloeopeniophorella convolvens]|nr:hypothetical protein BC834DRAFT_970998 [Gloeopeniophorella convolvens]
MVEQLPPQNPASITQVLPAPIPEIHVSSPGADPGALAPIELGTYVVFALLDTMPDGAPVPRHIGLVVDVRGTDLLVQPIARGRAPHPPFALPIAGPSAVPKRSAPIRGEDDLLRTVPRFPLDGYVQWATGGRTVLLRVVTQHEAQGPRCKLADPSMLCFAERVEDAEVRANGGGRRSGKGKEVVSVGAMPAEIWLDLTVADEDGCGELLVR